MSAKDKKAVVTPEMQEAISQFQASMALEFVDPQTIQMNDLNWKKHGTGQRRALREFRRELEKRADKGNKITAWVDTIKLNRRTGRLIDGHMRVVEALESGDSVIPALVFDVDEETETLILAYLDTVGSLYDVDDAAIQNLNEVLALDNALLVQLLGGELPAEERDEDDDGDEKGYERPRGAPLALPLGAKYDYVVLLFRREIDWNTAMDHFELQAQQCPFTRGVGLGRVVDGGKYLHRIMQMLDGAARGDLLDDDTAKLLEQS